MADFQEQAMGLTGLTIDNSSTAPSRAEFSTFLNDGVLDVTNRCLLLDPRMAMEFTRASAETTANNSLDINGAQVISVVREASTNNDWRNCKQIPPSMQSRVTDTASLHFTSVYNPSYTILENGIVNVYPVPDSNPNAFKVYYVNNAPEETDGSALDHASTGIKYFPSDKIYLVILYASMRSLLSAMGTTIASFGSYTPPVITNAQDGNFGDDTDKDLTTLSGAAWTALNYDFDAENMDPLKWFQVAGDMIQNQEDVELATIQLQKIGTYITGYNSAMQNNVSKQSDNVDKLVKDYSWMSDRYDKLNNEYYGYFKDIQDKKAQQQQAQQQAQQSYGR